MSKLLGCCVFLLLSTICFGQIFTKISPQNLVGLSYSHNAWIDYDNDGDLDFLITGATSTNDLRTILYENLGNDTFRPAAYPFNLFPQYSETDIAFLNLNGDDRIDVFLMGRRIGDATTTRMSLLENRITGFADIGPLPDFGRPQGFGTISIGDVNNDGTSDIFVSSFNDVINGIASMEASIYLNRGGAYIKSEASSIIGLGNAASKLADLDNDKDLDLIVCGLDGSHPEINTLIYLNDGTGVFQLASSQLEPLYAPSIDLADYDADQDLDILLTGLDQNLVSTTKLYKNTNGTFSSVALPVNLNRTAGGSARWGDFDNDGDVDILITGRLGNSPFTLAVFYNNGLDQFTELVDTSFENLGIGAASWGDYDNDGDLDILVTGAYSDTGDLLSTLYILKNGMINKSARPAKPDELLIINTSVNSCALSWNAATDDLTPASSLTYNLSIRNTNNGKYLQHPLSDNDLGKRRVNEMGNVGLNSGWVLNGLENGTYSIKVQSIDGSFLASTWSNEKLFYSGLPTPPTNLSVVYANGKIDLSWEDHSNNEQFFIIERRTNNGGFVKIDSTTANTTSYSDPYENFNFYEYRINAVNPNQRSPYSNTERTIIDAPTNLELDFKDGEIKLSWTDNSYSEKYFVVERKTNNSVFVKMDSTTANTVSYSDPYEDFNLYEYRVNAVNPNQRSSYSNTEQTIIDAPTNLELVFKSGEIKLSWTDNSYSEKYFIVERKTNNGSFVKIDSTTSNITSYNDPYEDFNLYEYRVNAVNPYQQSGYSGSVQTIIGTPTNLNATLIDGMVKLEWLDNSFNEKYFVIERRLIGATYQKVDSVTVGVFNYVEELNDGTYDYRIYGVNPVQRSSYSNEATVLVTGLEVSKVNDSFMYPNPASNLITVQVENGKNQNALIQILGLHGNLIQSQSLILNQDGVATLEMNSLPVGSYIIKIKTHEGGVKTMRLQKD